MLITNRRKVRHAPSVPGHARLVEGVTQAKVWQEFFCRTIRTKGEGDYSPMSQYGCGGYFVVAINPKFVGKVNMKCPKCGHVHTRYVKDGVIQEAGRDGPGESIDLTIMISAWSPEPRTVAMHRKRKDHLKDPRTWDAAVIRSPGDLVGEKTEGVGQALLRESWLNRLFGSERENKET